MIEDYQNNFEVMKALGLTEPLHFNEKSYLEAVNGMTNADGTKGPHFSIEQMKEIIGKQSKNKDFDMGSYNQWDYFYCLQMCWSDYSEVVEGKEDKVIELANAFIFDEDGKDGKPLLYWLAMKGYKN